MLPRKMSERETTVSPHRIELNKHRSTVWAISIEQNEQIDVKKKE